MDNGVSLEVLNANVKLQLTTIKPPHAFWLIELYNHLEPCHAWKYGLTVDLILPWSVDGHLMWQRGSQRRASQNCSRMSIKSRTISYYNYL